MTTRCPHCGHITNQLPRFNPNAERDAEIVRLNREGRTLEAIAALYRIGPTRVRQIIYKLDPKISLELTAEQRRLRDRDEAIVLWRKTGMTYREIAERYGICGARVREIVLKAERKERWRESIRRKTSHAELGREDR